MEVPALVELGPGLASAVIWHARLGLGWKVLAVTEDWTTPRYHDAVGTPAHDWCSKARASRSITSGVAAVSALRLSAP